MFMKNYSLETITLEEVISYYYDNGCNIDKTYQFFKQLNDVPCPPKLAKPFLRNKVSPDELRKLADKLDEYEKNKILYKDNVKVYQAAQNKIHELMVGLIKEVSGLNKIVPEQYRSKVFYHAWESGHSYGFNEVNNHLKNLVDIFE